MSDLLNVKSSYLKFLPVIFRGSQEETANFFERLLKVYENILTGIDDGLTVDNKEIKGISEIIDKIPAYFHPYSTSSEFIDWLASWVSLVLKEDWTERRKREVVAKIIPLYRMRGTRKGLEEYLNIYVEGGVKVTDNIAPFQVGINCKVGISTLFTTTRIPNYFIVETALSEIDPGARQRRISSIRSIVEKEKPVHTDYIISWTNVASMQIEVHSKVGVDTLLWIYD